MRLGYRKRYKTLAEAFYARVEVRGEDECWPWMGYRAPRGYGVCFFEGQVLVASRVSCELHHGPLAEGMKALHSCDNPPCVNPRHLRAGTDQDNSFDAISRGRWRGAVAKEYCKRGHLRTELLKPCRECQKEYNVAYKKAKPEIILAIYRARQAKKKAGLPTARPERTHCKRGHEFIDGSYRTSPLGVKECRICDRARRNEKRKAGLWK